MNNLIDKEIFSCPICCNEFSQAMTPICITCGHTLCKMCFDKLIINNTLICPIDKKKITISKHESIKNHFDNLIVIKIMRMLNLSLFDSKKLTDFQFYFCEDCGDFVSNKTSNVHKEAFHKIFDFSNYKRLKNDYYNDLCIKIDEILLTEKNKLNFCIFKLLDYFHYEKINKLFLINFELSEQQNENYYSFFSVSVNLEEISTFTKLILTELSKEINTKIHIRKGAFISDTNLTIHGLFLLENQRIKKALGVYKEGKDKLFYGLMNLHKNDNNSYDIYLDKGFLLNSEESTFYFGQFSKDSILPNYKHIYGEEVNLSSDVLVRKNSEYVFSDIPEGKLVDYDDRRLMLSKPIYDELDECRKNYTVEYFKQNEEKFEYIILSNVDRNTMVIKPEYKLSTIKANSNILDLTINEVYITFLKGFAGNSSIRFSNNYSFIVAQNFENYPSYSGYYFELIEKDRKDCKSIDRFFRLRNYKVRKVYKHLENFINSITQLLEDAPSKFKVLYLDTNKIKGNYSHFQFQCQEGKIIFHDNKNGKETFYSEKLKIFKIYDLFPNIEKKDIQEILESFKIKSPKVKNYLTQLNSNMSQLQLHKMNKHKGVSCKCHIF